MSNTNSALSNLETTFALHLLYYTNYIIVSCVSSLSFRLCCAQSFSVVSDSLWSRGPQPARLLCPWDSPGKNTGLGCYALLQGSFLTQGLNTCLLHLLHCRQILYCWATRGSPKHPLDYYHQKAGTISFHLCGSKANSLKHACPFQWAR